MPSDALIPFLIAMMLLTGVCNTLLTKYQDNQCVAACASARPRRFEQPVIQTLQMFMGEMGCWLVVACLSLRRRYHARAPGPTGYAAVTADAAPDDEPPTPSMSLAPSSTGADADERLPLTGWKTVLLSLPAICDICGTTLMNVGLLFVVASIYQMTRGALVLFVGLFSVLFLNRHLRLFQWAALVTVVVGVGIVGLAGAVYKDTKASPAATADRVELVRHVFERGFDVVHGEIRADESNDDGIPVVARTLLGVFLIAGAQVFTASQFVLEEFILERYELEPIKVVGWEGVFGFFVTLVGMIVMHLVLGRTQAGQGGYFDMVEGWKEITSNRAIGLSSLAIMVSIGGFNFFGLSVTRTVSATSRSTIDTCRTLFIWVVSLGLGWESFKWLQVVGFALLVYGTFLFNGLVRPPLKRWREPVEALLPEEPIEHI